MKNFKKLTFFAGIMSLVVTISGFTLQPAQEENRPKNLKVLPKNISEEELTKVMRGFNAALGVKCGYCHAPNTNGAKGLDFSSDANPKKNIACSMIKMTKKIKKKHLKSEHEGAIKNISCITCQNEQSKPKTLPVAE